MKLRLASGETVLLLELLETPARSWRPAPSCFWTQGDALALPYGRTPISTDARSKLANPCNVLGKVLGDPKALAKVKSGDAVKVEKA